MINHRFQQVVPDYVMSKLSVSIIGAGAVGANIGVILAKLGVGHFRIRDYQVVDEPNVGVQPFSRLDIAGSKVEWLSKTIRMNGRLGVEVRSHREKYIAGSKVNALHDIYILALHDLKTRHDYYKSVERSVLQYDDYYGPQGRKQVVIDPRMGVDAFEWHVVPLHNHPLYSDERRDEYLQSFAGPEPPPLECGLHGMPTTALCCASLVAHVIVQLVNGFSVPRWEHFDMQTRGVQKGLMLGSNVKKDKRLLAVV
jgi:hypothetical protein